MWKFEINWGDVFANTIKDSIKKHLQKDFKNIKIVQNPDTI